MNNMEFWGEFETHITLRLHDQHVAALQEWGAGRGLKCIHILLNRGDHVSQPMLTRRSTGGLSGQLDAALRLSRELNASGFPVIRIKIEAAPWNQDVPQSRVQAHGQPPGRYFEHHVKLLLPPDSDYAALAELVEPHSAHLSRNALTQRSDGREERFVTQRCRAVGYTEACQRLEALQAAIAPLGHLVLEVEQEYVVYDNNLFVDAGWITSEDR